MNYLISELHPLDKVYIWTLQKTLKEKTIEAIHILKDTTIIYFADGSSVTLEELNKYYYTDYEAAIAAGENLK